MLEQRFQVGDRVRARISSKVPAGTLGQIAQTLLATPELYFVRFDGDDQARLMHVAELELVTGEGGYS